MAEIKKSILHVEDDNDLQAFVNVILEDIAAITHVASLGEARGLIGINKFDLIILDLTLPDGSGLDLISELNEMRSVTPIVVFSSHEVTDNLPGVRRVFLKHRYSKEDLRNTVQALCNL